MSYGNEIPISIHFVDDNKNFLVNTSLRKLYPVYPAEITNKASKNLLQDN